jgi:hypothetical protein
MSLRIGFDLDGVLADMESALAWYAEMLFGAGILQKSQSPEAATAQQDAPDPAPGDDDSDSADMTLPLARINLTARQERRLWRHVGAVENFWESLTELEPGVIARLAATAAERRWEIIFLTKRPRTIGGTAQFQSQRWLASKGFPLPSVYVVQGSRGRIAAALDLDVVIDDRPENCLDVVVDSKARAILVWRDDERALPSAARRLGIGVVRSVGDCLDVLTTLDNHEAPQDPGLLARVRKMLGLKEPASA